MKYDNYQIGTFVKKDNRFTATCRLNDELIKVHIKNTGRNKELLISGVQISLVHSDAPKRVTHWDLVAVNKHGHWINIDSQAPNLVTAEGVNLSLIHLPGIQQVADFHPEVKYFDSRIDFKGESADGKPFFVEVKGVTLEGNGLAAFPDAPTTRAVKHVHTLIHALTEGYGAYLCLIVQMDYVSTMTIYRERAPKLYAAIQDAMKAGVQVVAYRCHVTPDEIKVEDQITFDLTQKFTEE
ncbi:DNA/RNA nuclease SfsA [Secundilactobacillus malefermentans]|uniref:Sugar fermentation stimulation protein homolog n=1 Tax=Secundilactobacillus malefermentans TaxID=176292 RepID=A0A4R5NPR5_9LACO|nr:DNA/RNA nuclease SfsA [Secundilactobacillus malefermentans]QEA31579.1 DNA/RNA nuclease SfsA [Secundilactobacillus malefermentans]TDG78621.1 hypothetical protein C5L31_001647 [Secundilactobacillus malefermentans]